MNLSGFELIDLVNEKLADNRSGEDGCCGECGVRDVIRPTLSFEGWKLNKMSADVSNK